MSILLNNLTSKIVGTYPTILDSPDKGIYLPPLIWGIQYKYSSEAVVLVFASENYDPDDYIRDYGEFVKARDTSLQVQ